MQVPACQVFAFISVGSDVQFPSLARLLFCKTCVSTQTLGDGQDTALVRSSIFLFMGDSPSYRSKWIPAVGLQKPQNIMNVTNLISNAVQELRRRLIGSVCRTMPDWSITLYCEQSGSRASCIVCDKFIIL